MNYPEQLSFTKDHEWIRFENEMAIIGITDFAQKELGDIVFLDINTLNEPLAREIVFGTIEAVKTVSDLFMPVSGVVLEVNEEINSRPELINRDPYGQGWLIKIKVLDAKDKEKLLTAEAYKKWIGVS